VSRERIATPSAVVARLDRATQYAAAIRLGLLPLEYWIARSGRAMTPSKRRGAS